MRSSKPTKIDRALGSTGTVAAEAVVPAAGEIGSERDGGIAVRPVVPGRSVIPVHPVLRGSVEGAPLAFVPALPARARASVRRGRRTARRGARAGRVRIWVPFLLLFAFGVWVCESLSTAVWAAGYTTIDTRRARFVDPALVPDAPGGGGFVDQRWELMLRHAMASVPAFDARDTDSAQALARAVRSLPFVSAVGEPEVLWPDGLELPLRLRTPSASVRVGDAYFAVSSDGVMLPGSWPAPPWIGQGFLPVIGPNDHAFDELAPGAVLSEPRHRDALAVAISMRATLSAADFEAMGPPLIDATRARLASPSEPGILLRLSARRVVYFGRAPDCGEPGELPVEAKWEALQKGLEALRASNGARDWSVLDARWDTPAIQWRDGAGTGRAGN